MTASGFPGAPGLDPHLDADALADLAEDLLDAASAEAARRHVEACALCSDDFALITGAAMAPWDAIEPEPIPADVIAHVEAALHREPPLRATPATHPAAVREVRQARSRRFLTAFKILAASGVVVGIGYVGVNVVSGGTSESKSSSTSVNAPAAGAPGPDRAAAGGGAQAAEVSPEVRALQLLASGNAHNNANATAPSPAFAESGAPDQLACWQALRPGAKILKSTPYVYQGRQAELLVFEVIGDASRADVVVATDDCRSQPLYTSSVTIPQ